MASNAISMKHLLDPKSYRKTRVAVPSSPCKILQTYDH